MYEVELNKIDGRAKTPENHPKPLGLQLQMDRNENLTDGEMDRRQR